MTQRERHSSSVVTEPAIRPATAQPSSLRPAPAAELARDTSRDAALSWETHFHSISQGQQQELLSLAEKQGVLYAHQLPPITNGLCLDPIRGLLPEILAGRLDHLEAIRPSPLTVVDSDLDETQREAVRLALDTPDVALIQGLPGTGKSRVAAEILTQAVTRGLRVLFVGSSAAGIDNVLSRIVGRAELCPLRCLSRDERLETLPPALRRASFSERLRQLTEHVAQAARRDREEAEQRRDRVRQDEAVLARLRPLVDRAGLIAEQLRSVAEQEARLAEQIEHTATELESGRTSTGDAEFTAAIAAALTEREQIRQRIAAKLAELPASVLQKQQERAELEKQIQQVAPLADAKQANRWWSTDWWRATLQGNVSATLDELKARQLQLSTALDELEEQRQELNREQTTAEEQCRNQQATLVRAEVARQREKVQIAQVELQQELQSLQANWQAVARELHEQTPAPAMNAEALVAAQENCRCRRDEDEQRASFAREWASGLEKHRAALPGWIIGRANIVAARWQTLANDEHFGPSSPAGRGFDLLLVKEAHVLSEPEFMQLARRAKRWVLIGEPSPAMSAPAREKPGRRKDSSPGRDVPSLFGPLWDNLHYDPRRLPYSWSLDAGRWCCRLRTLSPEQEGQLESENVADCPEIELRILALPQRSPVLAEVVFPPGMTISQAKQYIFRELQELAVCAERPAFGWTDEAERIVVRLSAASPTAESVTLYNGVRELVAITTEPTGVANGKSDSPACVRTCSLEFDRSAGWDRHSAAEWLARHLSNCDPGRTALLDVSYRMPPELAHFVSGLLAPSAYRVARRTGHADRAGAIQFIAVPASSAGESHSPRETPSAREQNGHRVAAPSRPRLARGGAGLELDLADPRQRERLPIALRTAAPNQGLANFTEAQAVVAALENLARDGLLSENAAGPAVAVTSAYPAQVALLRAMVRNSPVLSRLPSAVIIDDPTAFRHREYPLVILSLTRSHSHRAVSYGPDPQTLILGLTRAVSRLILVGDPGTLIRRTQWEGALDHLDEPAAIRERTLLQHLARHLPAEPATGQLRRREGNGT
jgi:hypothetical protein